MRTWIKDGREFPNLPLPCEGKGEDLPTLQRRVRGLFNQPRFRLLKKRSRAFFRLLEARDPFIRLHGLLGGLFMWGSRSRHLH